jgi:hypothetical protein
LALTILTITILQYVKELYPPDGSNPYVRMEALEIEMRVGVADLGRDEQVLEKLQATLKSSGASSAGVAAMGGGGGGSLVPCIISSQVPSDDTQLVLYPSQASNYFHQSNPQWHQSNAHSSSLGQGQDMVHKSTALCVRQVLPLLPLSGKGFDFTTIPRQVKAAVDNTLFVYPLLMDRFKPGFRCVYCTNSNELFF